MDVTKPHKNIAYKIIRGPGITGAWAYKHLHEITLELVYGADLGCNRHCKTDLVDLEGSRGQVWPKTDHTWPLRDFPQELPGAPRTWGGGTVPSQGLESPLQTSLRAESVARRGAEALVRGGDAAGGPRCLTVGAL